MADDVDQLQQPSTCDAWGKHNLFAACQKTNIAEKREKKAQGIGVAEEECREERGERGGDGEKGVEVEH